MSKRHQFLDKFQKKSRSRTEKENNDVTHSKISKRKTLDANSSSETSLPFPRPYNRIQSHICIEKVKGRTDFVCDTCNHNTKSKHITSRVEKDQENSGVDKATLDGEYIDNLVRKIKELKSRVNSFENQCVYGTVLDDNSPTCQYQRENKQIGDYDVASFKKWHKSKTDIRHNHYDDHMSNRATVDNHKTPFHHKFSNYMKDISDHQRSIYTAKGHNISPTITTAMVHDAYPNISKNQKNKSNTSIIMSVHSTSKSNFVKVNPHTNSKHFQAAAEEFIEHAEDLKTKIGYILECCGYNHSSTASDPSEGVVPSNYSLHSSSKEYGEDVISEQNLKHLFGAVNSQYSEILTSLMYIEKQIKSLNKQKVSKPLSKIPSKVSMFMPKNGSNSNFNRGDARSRSHTSGMAVIKNYSAGDAKLSHIVTKKQNSTEMKSSHLKSGKNGRGEKNLEPIVMVYEPIQPQYNILSGVCKYCGRELNSCRGCSEDSIAKTKKRARKNKKEDGQTQKYGFVVTYTPDISPDPNITPSTSKESTKPKKKRKKKIIPCLWF